MEDTGMDSSTNITLMSPEDIAEGSTRITLAVVLTYLTFVVMFIVNSAVGLLAAVSSVINVITFSKMDLAQGVNQNLLILSVSDSMVIVLTMLILLCNVLLRFGYNGGGGLRVDFVLHITLYLVNYPIYVSLIVTTTIAVVRCCSIVMPLAFRSVFTARRQLVAILCSSITISAILSYPVSISIISIVNPKSRGNHRFAQVNYMFDVFRNVFFYSCFGINVISVLFLIVALKKSAQFQRQSTRPGSDTSKQTLATREAQVVKVVILVLAVFLMCNIPLLLVSILRIALPEFRYVGKLYLWRNLLNAVNGTAVCLNVGLNLVVYYGYNSRFRQILGEMFTREKVEDMET